MKTTLNNIDFIVELTIKRNMKTIRVRIKDNIIKISAPYKLTNTELNKLINDNKSLILDLYNKSNKTNNIKNTIHYLGKEYDIKIIQSEFNSILLSDTTMYIHTTILDDNHISNVVDTFYINTLKNIVENNIDTLKLKFNIKFKVDFEYKNVKTYFGKCYFKRHLILLNTNLCKYDTIYILSVLYHEFTHFYIHNHQIEFYNYIESKFNNYRQIDKELKSIRYNDKY